jgi:hypothetical protein
MTDNTDDVIEDLCLVGLLDKGLLHLYDEAVLVQYRQFALRQRQRERQAVAVPAVYARGNELAEIGVVSHDMMLTVQTVKDDVYDTPLYRAAPPQDGVAYGIIDPDYARVFTQARCTAWMYGYALMMHGSFTRDLDLLAVPWTDSACPPEHLIKVICYRTDMQENGHPPTLKPHGRLAFTLMFKEPPQDPRFVDISVMPKGIPMPPVDVNETFARVVDGPRIADDENTGEPE